MKNSIYSYIVAASLALCCFAGTTAAQQGIEGDTSISYDDETGTVTVYGETINGLDTDYASQMSLVVKDQNGTTVASGNDYQLWDNASVALQFAATPGSVYTATSNHCVRLQSWSYDYEFPYPRFYYDYWYMSSFLGQNINWPLYYWFASPGWQEIHRSTNVICTGKTYSSVEVPPTVQKIQYKVNGTYVDVPTGGIGPICNGTSVDFKAIPTSGSFPSGKPTWGGDASGSGATRTVTFSTAGSRNISAKSGNTVTANVSVGVANSTITVTWAAANESTDSTTAMATSDTAAFVADYNACADPGANVWRLRSKTVDGGMNMHYHTGGYRDASASPPVNQAEAISANTALNRYYQHGAQPDWHTLDASKAHERYHYTEWKCSSDHFWPATESNLESLTVSYGSYSDESAAIAQLKTMTGGANSKITAFDDAASTYYNTLDDLPGAGKGYAAGQLSLNGVITSILNLASTNGWTGVPGVAATPSTTNPCYQTFQSYP